MKNKKLTLILMTMLCGLVITGCEKKEPTTVDPVEPEKEVVEEEKEPEENAKDTIKIDLDDLHTLYFANGKSFVNDETDWKFDEELDENGCIKRTDETSRTRYLTSDEQTLVELVVCDDKNDMLDQIGNYSKENDNATPIIDVHKEGTYLSGMVDGKPVFLFGAEAKDMDFDYLISISTVDMENGMDIVNNLIDDFIASDLWEDNDVYSKPVGEDDEDDVAEADEATFSVDPEQIYWTVPSGYEPDFECDWFISYESDDFEPVLYTKASLEQTMDESFKGVHDVIAGGDGAYYMETTTFTEVKGMSFSMKNGKEAQVVEANDGEFYKYFITGKDDSFFMELENSSYGEIDEKDIEKVVNAFVGQ